MGQMINSLLRERVLVVDDVPVNLELLARMLTDDGYEVRVACNGNLALQAVAAEPPDLILLDVCMPGIDGFEVCHRLKGDSRSQGIPVIFLSSHDDIENKLRAFEVGAVDYVGKPFETAEVLARVRTQLRLRRTERDLMRARLEAEQASRAKSQFLAAMSHELRTPLNTILGFSEIIRDKLFGRDAVNRYADYAGDIYDSGRYLLSLIDDILDIAKIECGQVKLEAQAVDVRRVLRAVMRLIGSQAREAGLALDIICESNLPYLLGDERGVKQILFNLLSNAIRFTPAGGTVIVRIRLEPTPAKPDTNQPTGQSIVLSVEDTGIGLPLDQILRLGLTSEHGEDPRYSRAGGAPGLGLALVKALTELHGGSLGISSAEGRGTTVTVRLPAVGQDK